MAFGARKLMETPLMIFFRLFSLKNFIFVAWPFSWQHDAWYAAVWQGLCDASSFWLSVGQLFLVRACFTSILSVGILTFIHYLTIALSSDYAWVIVTNC